MEYADCGEKNVLRSDQQESLQIVSPLKIGRFPLLLVADKSFYHDALRSDYERPDDAEWLFAYLVSRRAISSIPEKIMVTASSIIDRLSKEFRSYPEIPAQTILAIRNLTDVYVVPDDVNLGWAPLYVSRILYDHSIVPVIVSSVKMEKWMDRMKDAGLKWQIRGFTTEEISSKRVRENAWSCPLNAGICATILKGADPLYNSVTKLIGPPPVGRQYPSSP